MLNPHKYLIICVVMSQWDADLHARIAAAIKKHRGAGRSAQWLADKTAELGYPISRAQIANYESGRKKNLDIAELLILAAALDVPPMVLLYPDLPAGQVEIIPGRIGTSWVAYLWATGIGPSLTSPAAAPTAGERLIAAVRERSDLMAELAHLHVNAGLYGYDAALKASLESRRTEVAARISRLNAEIHEAGGVINDA